MKPRTATEISIVESSNALPAITKSQYRFGFTKCFGRYAVQSRKTMFCLECGHTWRLGDTTEIKKVKCDNCAKTLTVTGRYNNGMQETDYFQIITTSGNFQVVRTMCVKK